MAVSVARRLWSGDPISVWVGVVFGVALAIVVAVFTLAGSLRFWPALLIAAVAPRIRAAVIAAVLIGVLTVMTIACAP